MKWHRGIILQRPNSSFKFPSGKDYLLPQTTWLKFIINLDNFHFARFYSYFKSTPLIHWIYLSALKPQILLPSAQRFASYLENCTFATGCQMHKHALHLSELRNALFVSYSCPIKLAKILLIAFESPSKGKYFNRPTNISDLTLLCISQPLLSVKSESLLTSGCLRQRFGTNKDQSQGIEMESGSRPTLHSKM